MSFPVMFSTENKEFDSYFNPPLLTHSSMDIDPKKILKEYVGVTHLFYQGISASKILIYEILSEENVPNELKMKAIKQLEGYGWLEGKLQCLKDVYDETCLNEEQ